MADFIANRPGGLVQSHKGSNPRILLFYLFIALALLVLTGGLAYRQLLRADIYGEKEKVQNQRRILIPGPRGNIFDREGRLLVGNRPRFAAAIYLDELRLEFRTEYLNVRRAFRDTGDVDVPTPDQLSVLARHAVVTRYLARINTALGRRENVDSPTLEKHFRASPQLPFALIEDLQPTEYARLLEHLPVNSPLQVYTSSTRFYPHGSTASHTLGYVSSSDEVNVADDFPGADLMTFRVAGTGGRNGLEAQYDDLLRGEAGGSIYRVDPSGVRVEFLERRRPVQGQNVVSSLDLDLQLAGEKSMEESAPGMSGAAVALDIATGEVLALVSKPDFNLNLFAPRLGTAAAADIAERGAWINRATQGLYPPGSTFKMLTAVAGLRSNHIQPDSVVTCTGAYRVGGRIFVCNNHRDRGAITFLQAIEKSCNTFFYDYGLKIGAETIAAEARRFGFGSPTGLDLPYESTRSLVPDAAWKRARVNEAWFPGDTANYAIGQGFLLVTPLQMATFTASLARGQLLTTPSLLHEPPCAALRPAPTGLSAADYQALMAGMQLAAHTGTARVLQAPFMRIPGLRIAGKTGTAQKASPAGTINFAWFIAFAPVERPQIAVAVMIEGDTPSEEAGGSIYAVPVARALFKAWADKHPDRLPLPLPASTTPAT